MAKSRSRLWNNSAKNHTGVRSKIDRAAREPNNRRRFWLERAVVSREKTTRYCGKVADSKRLRFWEADNSAIDS